MHYLQWGSAHRLHSSFIPSKHGAFRGEFSAASGWALQTQTLKVRQLSNLVQNLSQQGWPWLPQPVLPGSASHTPISQQNLTPLSKWGFLRVKLITQTSLLSSPFLNHLFLLCHSQPSDSPWDWVTYIYLPFLSLSSCPLDQTDLLDSNTTLQLLLSLLNHSPSPNCF